MPIWCQRGPSPHGIGWREKYRAGATAWPAANAQAAFTNDARICLRVGRDRQHQGADVVSRIAQRRDHRAQLCRGNRRNVALQIDHDVVPPVGIELGQCDEHAIGAATAGRDRSVLRGLPRRAPRRRSPHRRMRPRPARGPPRARAPARARSSACRGCRRAACRATVSRPCGRDDDDRVHGWRVHGLMGKGRFPMVRAPYGGARPRATPCRRTSVRL